MITCQLHLNSCVVLGFVVASNLCDQNKEKMRGLVEH